MGLLYHPELDSYVSWPVMVGAVAGYLLSIVVLRSWMANREKFTLSLFMKFYNAVQVVLCAYMIWGFGNFMFTLTNPFGLNTDFNAATEWFMFVHYASKYLDYFDTWIMILKKNDRQLSFLHVYHHASILLVWGYLLQLGQGNGTAYFGAAINSVIHLIMYSHFLYTSFGLVNPFKKVVTQCQIIQFYMCLLHAVLAVVYEEKLDANLAWLQLGYHVTMLVLFNNFYEKTYKEKPAKEAIKGSAPAEKAEAKPAVSNAVHEGAEEAVTTSDSPRRAPKPSKQATTFFFGPGKARSSLRPDQWRLFLTTALAARSPHSSPYRYFGPRTVNMVQDAAAGNAKIVWDSIM